MKKRGVTFARATRGQAAIFLVISLIILLSGLAYFAYKNEVININFNSVPAEAAPVKLFVDNCIKSVTEQGLELIGLTGGYIDTQKNDPRAYLESGLFRMPYWWYDGIEAIPTENFVRTQLESYVESELKNCIADFETFDGRFEITQLKEPDVQIEFTENDVRAKVDYVIEVIGNNGDFKTLIKSFEYTINIRFKKVFELAKLIMERENKDYFIEKKTIDLLSMTKDIPTTDVAATCDQKTWLLSGIQEKMKNLIRVNIPYIRIQGTSYNKDLYVPSPDGKNTYANSYFAHHYVWDLGEYEKYKNMKVSFNYENYPLEMYARPSENGILKSNSQKGSDMLSFFCLHIWHFTYDVKYPVVASIFDLESSNNRPYQFNFAFRVDVDHNTPNRVKVGNKLFEEENEIPSQEFCNNVQNEVTIFTADNSTGEDIRNVNLTFVCGRFYCEIGKSDWLSFGSSAGLTKRLPYCVNAIIKGKKAGYDDGKMFIQSTVDGNSYILLLNPAKEFTNYKIIKHSSSNYMSSEISSEKASIRIKGKNFGFDSFGTYPSQKDFPIRLALKDATYEVEVYLIDNENIIGGYLGELKVTKDEVESANEIIFHVVDHASASEDERTLFISGLRAYSSNVPAPQLR